MEKINGGVKQLKNKLDIDPLGAWTKAGRVKVNKSMTKGQLSNIIRVLTKFESSKVYSKTGIREIREKQIESIKKRFNYEIDDLDLTYEDAENIYQIYESGDYNWIFDYFTESEFDTILQESIDQRVNLDGFIDILITYNSSIPIQDLDIKVKIDALYRKFVEPYI